MVYPAIVLSSQLKGFSSTWSSLWIVFMHNFSNAFGKISSIFRKVYTTNVVFGIIIARFGLFWYFFT